MNFSLALEGVENGEALARMVRQAAEAGFQGVELIVGADGVFAQGSTPADCHESHQRVADAGLEISALSLRRKADEPHLASTDGGDRRRAYERIIAALDRAAWLHTRMLVFTPVFLGGPGDGQVRYEEAYGRAVEALLGLRFEAQQRGVLLACAIRDTRFLLSPTEARGFIDRVNSPFVGLSLDLGALVTFGYAEDWVASLGHRVGHVYLTDQYQGHPTKPCVIGEGDVNWRAVGEALRAARYAGPMTLPASNDSRGSIQSAARVLGESPN